MEGSTVTGAATMLVGDSVTCSARAGAATGEAATGAAVMGAAVFGAVAVGAVETGAEVPDPGGGVSASVTTTSRPSRLGSKQ